MNNYIKNKNKNLKNIPGRPEKLGPKNKQAIIRDVRKSGKSVSKIQLPGDINVSRWTIWRTLKNFPNVEYLEHFFRIAGNRAIFQQDNAPIHVSRHSKAFFRDKNVLMDWPALSPDLNPIENCQVYGQSKQYDSKVSLTGAIMKSWSEIDDQTVKSLIGSIKNHCIEVIAVK